MKKYDVLNDEKLFPYEGMSLGERNLCLDILNNCKDICDSINSIGNIKTCNIVEMHFKRENGIINCNGSLVIGDDVRSECRCIDAYIFFEKNRIIVDMLITRLCVDTKYNQYRVLDIFTLNNGIIHRKSNYNHDLGNYTTKLVNQKVKGRLE